MRFVSCGHPETNQEIKEVEEVTIQSVTCLQPYSESERMPFTSVNATRRRCPMINIICEGKEISALVDTGCTCSVIVEDLLNEISKLNPNIPQFPMHKSYIVGANKKRSRPISRQVLLQLTIGLKMYDVVCIVAKELLYPLILGMDFLHDYGVVIDLSRNAIQFPLDNTVNCNPEDDEQCMDLHINCVTSTNLLTSIEDTINKNEEKTISKEEGR